MLAVCEYWEQSHAAARAPVSPCRVALGSAHHELSDSMPSPTFTPFPQIQIQPVWKPQRHHCH